MRSKVLNTSYYLNRSMEISKKSKKKIVELAKRFTRHSPPLCRDHSPDGLPVDAPEDVGDISENHPSYKFEKIVENEARDDSKPKQVAQSYARSRLRKVFAEEYYSHGDGRSCVQCYEERKQTDEDMSVRMELPDDWNDGVSNL